MNIKKERHLQWDQAFQVDPGGLRLPGETHKEAV